MTSFPVFDLRQVSQQFGRFLALDDINLKIYPGERVALVGSSGAGKSTLLRLLNGTLLPSQGEVWVLGQNLSRLSSRKLRDVQRQIGTIYQQFHLVDSLRVIHNVNAGQLGRWSFWRAALSLVYPLEVKTAAAALRRVGIPEKLYARTDQLSGGQQQRVAIARVLVQDPLAILADEPVSSLDPTLSREVMDLLRILVQESGKTLVTSLHSVELAQNYCDRIIGLRDGKILFDSPPASVSAEMIDALYHLKD
ncbi:MAG: phosphonate ABC transporter ATP-binding protein [Leptolyngbyaceae cyanobacterium SM1_4_3]|nr:phosphonate ABC transporter ATP-binding protein [Leptolyngbyaceae cyanobacterium SM1_4_3]